MKKLRFGKYAHVVKGKMGDQSGAVAIFTALALPALLVLIGGGVDYAQVVAAQSKLQKAADSASLATYKHYSSNPDISDAELKAYFSTHLKTSLQTRFEQQITIKTEQLSLDPNAGKLDAYLEAEFPTKFVRLIGFPTMTFNIGSQVQASINYTEVALVLDTTGSMQGEKLEELKRAATQFLDTIHSRLQGDKEAFKVAIVPFGEYVNVGKDKRGAWWLDVPPDMTLSKTTTRTICKEKVCDKTERQPYTRCYWKGNPDGQRVRVCEPSFRDVCVQWHWEHFTPCKTASATSSRNIRWEGCVGSRDYPLNLRDESYGTRVPGVMNYARRPDYPVNSYDGWHWRRNRCGSPLTPLMTLKDNKDALVNSINALRANGFTYIPSGLVWGWRVLSHKAPFAEGASDADVKRKDIRRIIVLMTDGANTVAPNRRRGWAYADHRQKDRAYADRMTRELCNNIKASNPATGKRNAEIITVTFDVWDTGIKDLMQSCASLGSFDAKSGDLAKVFDQIAMKLVELHLSK